MSLSTVNVLDRQDPFRVPDHIGAVHVIVMNNDDDVPAAVHAMMNASPTRLGLRIAGGCSNMEASDKETMLEWFGSNLADFRGFVSSGATREVSDGVLDPMVTEVPALLARSGQVVTVSTVPRVGTLQLVDQSRLQLFRADKYGVSTSYPNPGVHMIVVVQDRLGSELDWDGDVLTYVDTFNTYRRTAGWQFASIVWNGGGVTRTEVKRTARSGWPVILVEGSGRAADEYIAAIRAGNLIDLTLPGDDDWHAGHYDPGNHPPFHIVSKDEPTSLRDKLVELGFMP